MDHAEVAKHSTPSDMWVVVKDTAYDLTTFAPNHPGGAKLVERYAGRDATEEFLAAHPESIIKTMKGPVNKGKVNPATIPASAKQPIPGMSDAPAGQAATGSVIDSIPPLSSCINVFDFEAVAVKKMLLTGRKKGLDYYSSGAEDEITLRENHNAFHRIFLRPRVLVNVSNVDTSTNVMGYDCAFPAYMSAVALQKLGHPLGELNWARAAKTCNVLPMFPTLASCR